MEYFDLEMLVKTKKERVGKKVKDVSFLRKQLNLALSQSRVQAPSSQLSDISQFPGFRSRFRFKFNFKLWDMLGLTERTKVAEKVLHAMPTPCHACQSHTSPRNSFFRHLEKLSSHPWHKLS